MRKAEQIAKASQDLAAAEHALRSFDSQPVKSKKKVKQEMQEFPTLEGQAEFIEQKKAREEKDKPAVKVEEEKQPEEPTLGSLQSAAGGKRKRKGKGNANVVE